MDSLARDLRYALRMLGKSPLVTGAAVLSLALGIGANTAMFSWVVTILLSPIRVHEPYRLVHLFSTNSSGFRASYSYLNYRDERDRNEVFEEMTAARNLPLSFSDGPASERIYGQAVSGNFFSMAGVEASLGRTFTQAEDEVPGRDAVCVLSHGFWQRRFAGDRAVVGRTIRLNGHPFTVLGVLPESYLYATVSIAADLYAPLNMMAVLAPGTDRLGNRGWGFLDVVARLKPGVSLETAQAHMRVVAQELAEAHPDFNEDRTVVLVPETKALLPQSVQGAATSLVAILMGVVSFVLLIACANVANLQMARAKARENEVGLRLALGAGRGRLLRQLLTESLVLSVLAGAAGVALAFAINRALQSIPLPVGAPVRIEVGIDWRVLAFTSLVTLLAAVAFGLAPAIRATSSPSASAARVVPRSRFAGVLVTGQMALSLVLLIGASLFLKSLGAAQAVEPGFDPERVLLAAVDPNLQGYASEESERFYERLLESVRGLPGVRSASFAVNLPMQLSGSQYGVSVEGYVPAENERMNVDYNVVAAGYFETMRIPILAGRDFGPEDGDGGQGALIVSETMAKRFWPNSDPIGRSIRAAGERVVVGVAADTKVYSLGEEPLSYMYFPYRQAPRAGGLTLHVRTENDPMTLVEPVRGQVRALDPALPVFGVDTLEQRIAFALLPSRLSASILGTLGGLALLMASIGLYGVTAYGVSQRTREIGLRMALGAAARDVMTLVLGKVALLSSIGVALGLLGGFALSIAARGVLFAPGGERSFDAASSLLAAAVILLSALLAGYLPARRAAAADPMVALRHE
jgi:predicted permease